MKTISLKKVSAVAVASLGFGLLSVVPATAAPVGANAAATVTSINITRTTSSPKIASAVKVNVGMMTTASGSGTTIALKASLTSTPTGGWVAVSASTLTATGSSASTSVFVGAGSSTASGSVLTIQSTDGTGVSAASVSSSATVGVGSFSFTPAVVGDYVLTVWNDASDSGNVTGSVDLNEARQTISITVAAKTGYSNSLSTSILNSAASGAVSGTSDAEIRLSKTTATDLGTVVVTLLDTSGAALNGLKVQADVTGPGLVLVDEGANVTTDGLYRSHSATIAANVAYVHIETDGTAGTGTVTIKVLDATTGETLGTLATETYYTYGTVSKITATGIMSVAKAGTEIGCKTATACTQLAVASTPFAVLKAEDSAGNLVPALSISAVPLSTSVIGSSVAVAVTEGFVASTAGVSTDVNGLGYYNVAVTGAVGAASGASTTVTWRTQLADLTYVTSNALTISVGGTLASEVVTLDKTTYAPGEAMVVTRTGKDSAGFAPYDGQTASAVVFSKPTGGSAVTASYYVGGVKKTSATAPTVFAPVVAGSFSATLPDSLKGTSAAASVTDANAGLLTQIDALNAKIVALNALIAKIMKKLGVK